MPFTPRAAVKRPAIRRVAKKKMAAKPANYPFRPVKRPKEVPWQPKLNDRALCMILILPRGHEYAKPVFPMLGTYGAQSQAYFHMLLPGYQADDISQPPANKVSDWKRLEEAPAGEQWWSSDQMLKEHIELIESHTSWRYDKHESGVVALIFDIHGSKSEGKTIWDVLTKKYAYLDTAIVCDIVELQRVGLINSFEEFFRTILRFVKKAQDGGDAELTRRVSDLLGFGKSNVIKNLFEAFGKEKPNLIQALTAIFRVRVFAVKDIRLKGKK